MMGRRRQFDPEIAEVLNRAADLLEHTALIQGHYAMRPFGDDSAVMVCEPQDERACGFCTHGAILAVMPKTAGIKLTNGTLRYIVQTLEDIDGLPRYTQWGTVHHWTDESGRTLAEVLAVLRRAGSLERLAA